MALYVMSAKRKQGTFEGKTYDNVIIFCENPESTNEQLLFGAEEKQLKIKMDAFTEAFNRNKANGFAMVQEMKGAIIQPVYDEWGNVQDFTLFRPETSTNGAQNKK
ncbi:MAG: hypothetical protein ACI4KA_00105 [Oscillospiraceae bacterium]